VLKAAGNSRSYNDCEALNWGDRTSRLLNLMMQSIAIL